MPESKGSGNLTWVLSVVAVVAVVGLLYWLGVTAKPSTVHVAASSLSDSAAAATPGVPTVQLSDFATQINTYEGKTIRVPNLKIASLLGTEAFWITLPNSQPYLVKLDSTTTVAGGNLAPGAQITIEGSVQPMSDSVLADWQKQGAITANQKSEASFAQTFLQASRATIQPAAADTTGGAGAGGAGAQAKSGA